MNLTALRHVVLSGAAGVLLLATAATTLAIPRTSVGAAAHAPSSQALVKVIHEAGFGRILVTSKGFALYYFTPEKHGAIKCTGQCAKVWPPLLLPAGVNAPMHLRGVMGTFGVVIRPDKTRQLTFDGKPLYKFVDDKKPGQVLCDGVGGWYAVRVNGH